MDNDKSSMSFDREHALSHDKRLAKLAPMRESLHLMIRMALSELPAEARILCVGVGTGQELVYLAQAFPQWRFTAVEPAVAMLDICRQRAMECGIASRCTFHEGYLNSLQQSEAFDAAICILVSQFFMQVDERRDFFRQIADLLRPGGVLVSADLASDMSSSADLKLFEFWVRTMKYADIPAEEVEKLGRDVAVLPPQEIESIIASGGFDAPVLIFQSLLIHAWYAKLSS